MRHEPAEYECGLPGANVIHEGHAKKDAIVEQLEDRSDAESNSQTERKNRNLNIVSHEAAGEFGMMAAQPVVFAAFFVRHSLCRVPQQMRELRRHNRLLRFLVEGRSEAAKEHGDKRDEAGHNEGPGLPAKGARKFVHKPMDGTELAPTVARFVNFAVGASGERFEVVLQLGFGSESGDTSEVRRDLLVEQMEPLHFLEGHLPAAGLFETIEHLFQLRPGGTLGGDEAREVDDHGDR